MGKTSVADSDLFGIHYFDLLHESIGFFICVCIQISGVFDTESLGASSFYHLTNRSILNRKPCLKQQTSSI